MHIVTPNLKQYDTGPWDSDSTDSEPGEIKLFQVGNRRLQSILTYYY